jgi:hypothetical protein
MKLERASGIKELCLPHRRYQDLPKGHEVQRKAKENRGDGGGTHAQRVKVHLCARGEPPASLPPQYGRDGNSLLLGLSPGMSRPSIARWLGSRRDRVVSENSITARSAENQYLSPSCALKCLHLLIRLSSCTP